MSKLGVSLTIGIFMIIFSMIFGFKVYIVVSAAMFGFFAYLAVAGYLKRNNQDDPSNDGYYEFLENVRN
ncbi:hypothetical protein [Paenibacillus polymyxa]|uniref:hypothetical protein n=1 Tax=Paenibacillus polymyxa TaxID=1406 RepID=UPI0008BF38AB|nr:hypothetical protein [Paenibacillus polymyxa]MBE3646868.1 hypothetical protein [Paenibacillus polymyxa]SEJ94101.1 hypothetical protein SAMN04488600_106185 [Paenibacillus polymyxa]